MAHWSADTWQVVIAAVAAVVGAAAACVGAWAAIAAMRAARASERAVEVSRTALRYQQRPIVVPVDEAASFSTFTVRNVGAGPALGLRAFVLDNDQRVEAGRAQPPLPVGASLAVDLGDGPVWKGHHFLLSEDVDEAGATLGVVLTYSDLSGVSYETQATRTDMRWSEVKVLESG